MAYKTEKTAPKISVGADKEQPSQKCTVNIITENSANFNGFEKRNGYTHRIISNIGWVQVVFQKAAPSRLPVWSVLLPTDVGRGRHWRLVPLGEATTSLQPKC